MLNASTIVEAFAEATIEWHRLPGKAPDETPSGVPTVVLRGVPGETPGGVSEALGSAQAALPLQPVLLGLHPVVLALHRANFDLWHEEDKARNPGATDAEIAQVKRNIDRINQQRNDLVEQCDRCLVNWLTASGLLAASAPLHSETPGLMLDRLSILTLKVYHTQEETERGDAPEGHRERNLQRLLTLKSQRADLVECLDCLWSEIMLGRRRFKLYQQLKMYNDPTLNPVLYNSPE